jgi:phosphoribosylformimino-5-aminoimidazole carboxamide ribonucleotide (ProFAR) isomerase
MIIPCIDLKDGRAVQLVHGRKQRLAVEDVFGLLDRFKEYPLLHIIDLDAAMGRGSNARLVRALCQRAPMRVRVGGGIRTTARAARILDGGAEKIIVGSAAFPGAASIARFFRAWRSAWAASASSSQWIPQADRFWCGDGKRS